MMATPRKTGGAQPKKSTMSAVPRQRAQMRASRRRTSPFQYRRPDIDDRTGFQMFWLSARLIASEGARQPSEKGTSAMNYFLLFQDAGGQIYSHCNMAAVSNDVAIVKARRIYSSSIGSGYEIWRAGHHVHTESATLAIPLASSELTIQRRQANPLPQG